MPRQAVHGGRRLLPAFAPDEQSRPSPPSASTPSLHPVRTSSSSTTSEDVVTLDSSVHSGLLLPTSRQPARSPDSSQTDVSSAEESYGPETPPAPDGIKSPGWVSSSAKPAHDSPLPVEPTKVEEPVSGVPTSPSDRQHVVLAASTDGMDRRTAHEAALPVVEVRLEQASRAPSAARPSPPQTPRARQPRLSSLAPATSSAPRPRSASPRSLALHAARERQTKAANATDGQNPAAQGHLRRNEPRFEDALFAHRGTIFRSLLE